MSSGTGPYSDREVDSSLFRYDYRAGSTAGDNTKLRRACELGLSSLKWATNHFPYPITITVSLALFVSPVY